MLAWPDLIIGGITIFFVLRGYAKGFVSELATVLADRDGVDEGTAGPRGSDADVVSTLRQRNRREAEISATKFQPRSIKDSLVNPAAGNLR